MYLEQMWNGPTQAEIERIVGAGVLAPSGDNRQPWTFHIDPAAGRIVIEVDPARDTSPMNAGQRMARIACGAAVENMVRSARRHGFVSAVTEGEQSVELQVSLGAIYGTDKDLRHRVTNRRPYDARPLNEALVKAMRVATPADRGVATQWITERGRIERMADVIAAADTLMLSEPTMRNAFLANVRFDAPVDEAVSDGLCLGALEISRSQSAAMKKMPLLPNTVFSLFGSAIFGTHTRKLVASASGVCVITAADSDEISDFRVGRLMQRAWLALTHHGMAVQPMMSLPVLSNALENAPVEIVQRIGAAKITALSNRLAQEFPGLTGRIAAILRFGYAPPPSARTGRRPVDAVMHQSNVAMESLQA